MDRRTIDAYDVYHEVYDAETRDFWERFPAHILDSFVDKLNGKVVLNLGSGPGRDAILLKQKGLEVVCVDGSQKMVDTTTQMGFKSVKCDFRDLDFPESSFDGVWAYSSLIHVNMEEAALILRQVHSILKPGGILLLGLIEGQGSEEVRIAGSNFTRYFEYYDEKKLDVLLKNGGFKAVETKTYMPGNHTYLNLILEKENL